MLKIDHILRRPRASKSSHLVKKASKGPDISLHVIAGFLVDLWRQVTRCTYVSMQLTHSGGECLRNAKVAQFTDTFARQEDVLRLDISVHNLTVMTVLQT